MTPAELDTRRRALGLSVDETARLLDVTPRTVNRWERGLQDLPAHVPALLGALEERMEVMVDRVVETVTHRVADVPVNLHRYRDPKALAAVSDLPPGPHAMMIAWAADALAGEGVAVQIVWAG